MENPAETPSLSEENHGEDIQPQSTELNNGSAKEHNTEFAEKPPLLTPKSIRKIVIGVVIFIIAIIGLVVVAGIIRSLTEEKPPVINPGPIINPDQEEVVQTDQPILAYIKDYRNLWTVDINGENKTRIIELSPTGNTIFTGLAWKNEKDLTYSVCKGDDLKVSSCISEVITLENKSTESLIPTTGDIRAMKWSSNEKYFAYIVNEEDNTNFRFKSGTIDSKLESNVIGTDLSRTKSQVIFSPNNQYVIYSAPFSEVIGKGEDQTVNERTKISIYQVNGVKVDEIIDATDPMIFEENTIIYKKNGQLMKRTIGNNDEAAFTVIDGYNAKISPEKSQIAYWRTEGNLNNIILGVFDADLNIHRNILRGVLMPEWLTEKKVAGIKADNCLGSNCQLYEFKTNSLVIVDIKDSNVIPVDQGKKISSITFLEKQEIN